MSFYKTFDNGLRLVVTRIEGLLSVSAGIMVRTGSVNESDEENGISHYIEHGLFKGTDKRTAFEISDRIDSIGAQINAFTSKELTCYYTKSTCERFEDSLEVLSDIFFNATFDDSEMKKEKGVIIEEINMCEDTPEDLLLDLLAESYYGKTGFGKTILGSIKNVSSFTRQDVKNYMDKYYTADNVVISVAGNVEEEKVVELVEKYFSHGFSKRKSHAQFKTKETFSNHKYKVKKIEQTHIGMAFKGMAINDPKMDAFNIASTILGGGMSSRLFQTIREELGLAYSVYSYPSYYKDNGVMEIYAGVNTESKKKAFDAIIKEVSKMQREKITEQEFLRGKEQIRSSLILGQESTSAQMLLYGKRLIFMDQKLDIKDRIKDIDAVTINDVCEVIDNYYKIDSVATATVGPTKGVLKI